jgi:hypothetical protein
MCIYHVMFLSKYVFIMWLSCLNVPLSCDFLNVYYLHLIMLFCLVNDSFVDQLICELFPSTVYCFPSIFNWSIIDESVEQMKQISNIFIIKYDPRYSMKYTAWITITIKRSMKYTVIIKMTIKWGMLVMCMECYHKIQQIIFDYIFFYI